MKKRWAFIGATVLSLLTSWLTSYIERGNIGEKLDAHGIARTVIE